MLFQRLLFGGLLIAGVAAAIWGDIQISRHSAESVEGLNLRCGSVIPLVMLLLAMAGGLECGNLARAAGYEPLHGAVFLGVLALNALAWMIPAGVFGAQRNLFEFQLIVVVLSTLLIGLSQILKRQTRRGLGDVSVSIMILIYMGVLPSFITAIRTLLPGSNGVWAVVMFVAVVKLTDIGAYFVGMAIGKTRLIPSISPAKTVEGLAGGVLLAIVSSVALARWLPWETPFGDSPIRPFQAVLFGALIAILGSAGDLVESIFKRDATSKDSAQVIPAFGGILDLLDSPAFAAPLGYLLLSAWLG